MKTDGNDSECLDLGVLTTTIAGNVACEWGVQDSDVLFTLALKTAREQHRKVGLVKNFEHGKGVRC